VCGVDGCTETFRQRGKLSLHRRTHDAFKKKEYRLLNGEAHNPNRFKIFGKKMRRYRPEEDTSSENASAQQEEEIMCAKKLSDNWSPLKKIK
jgi:hypothetical protein